MLFIDDDECEIGDRREDRGACAHDHASLAALDAMPLLGAFFVRQSRVQDGHFIAENLMQIGSGRRRKANFRNQQDGGAPSIENRTHARKINGSFARTGDAMQQDAGKPSCVHRFAQAIQSGLLRWIEIEFQARGTRPGTRDGECRRLSIISMRPRLTSVLKVVRGTSSACSVSTGTSATRCGKGFDQFPLIVI